MSTRRRLSFHLASRNAIKRLAILFLILAIGLVWVYFRMIRMPGESFHGPLPPMTQAQAQLSAELRRDVEMIAGTIGRRNVFYPTGYKRAADFIDQSLAGMGYTVTRQKFKVMGVPCFNIEVEIKGATKPNEIVIVGAHYDSVEDSPAANDNGSGVAATLALAEHFAIGRSGDLGIEKKRDPNREVPARTLRFVFFANEEPPFFQTTQMGSLVYAKACKSRDEDIVAMISLETIGCYFDEPGSQRYPIVPIGWMYATVGNFIGFVGNHASRDLLHQSINTFRSSAKFPSEGAAMPGWIPGVGWSDQWAFWQVDYPGIMITDTAPYRYPHYHTLQDTPDKLDYEKMARVVEGVRAVIEDLAGTN